ncbi:DUF4181 domain-containing protein [Paenibacillus sp. N3/727]|uniref:DUF4181 domain-containing protein n=1 Tax=Paenibacillus sp. N3/727 TaxID=2925845 RepID=UPI001F52CA0F|nr:DUF4181 domain-containing protein [Paenibacillus sp. N3/727]UNK16223.1 DUF4181 domain-containing protein [Paenibacillus sp. N3/727]
MGISISSLLIILVIVRFLIKLWFVKGEKIKISETSGKRFYSWGAWILILISLVVLFNLDFSNMNIMRWFWLFTLIIAFSFNAFAEWKYIRESKEHIISLVSLMIGMAYILLFMF